MVYKRGGVWWFKFTWNGQSIRESTKQGNKRVAEQIEAARKTGIAKGEAGIRNRAPIPTLTQFSSRFTEAIETLCADKPNTVLFYKDKLKCLLASDLLAGRRIDEIDEAVIEAYKQRRTKARSNRGTPFSVASVNRELATLRRLLRLAQEWKVINRVPRVRLLRGEKSREFVLNHQQEAAYLAALPTPFCDVAMLLLDGGLRVSEALSLEWGDVRLTPASGATFGYLTIRAGKSKNSKSRNVPLTVRVLEMLKQCGERESRYVFERADGVPLYQTWLNQQHSAVRNKLKLPKEFVPHSLRHTFGTRLGESGADAFTIMRLMGHSSVIVSQRYVHPSPESVERAFVRFEALNAGLVPVVGTKLGTVTDTASAQLQ